MSPPILVDYQRDGRTVKGLVNVARNGYLWFLERSAGPISFVAGHAVRAADRVPQPRSEDRPARRRPGAQAGAPARRPRLLSVALGRQELAADRLQPEDADDLHPGQREPVRLADRQRGRVRGRASASSARPAALVAARRAPTTSAKCRPGTSTPARGCGRTRIRPRRTGARCWPPAAAWCSPAAPTIASCTPSTRSRASCCGSSRPTPASSRQPSSFTVDGKQYIAVQSGLGHRLARHAEPAEHADRRRVSRRCPRAARSGCSRCRRRSFGSASRRALQSRPAPGCPGRETRLACNCSRVTSRRRRAG